MENVVNPDPSFWKGRRVFLTGHTGFKGGWLSVWLQEMGAVVRGYALNPPTDPSLFVQADVAAGMDSVIGDIRDYDTLLTSLIEFQPEVVFHLAAQPLVRDSYKQPRLTYETNVMGTVNLLEAVRHAESVRSVVVVTTDKVYENREWHWGYRENDRLGGYDPYSNSKAAAELVVAAYRSSFFNAEQYGNSHHVSVASARAGNVIGGGDWATDRIVPDLIRAWTTNQPATIRNPHAIRPWQHVLEPLSGYLVVAERLYDSPEYGEEWNFGPRDEDCISVGDLAAIFEVSCAGLKVHRGNPSGPHEARFLKLDISKAKANLNWIPKWSVSRASQVTVEGYRSLVGAPSREPIAAAIREYGQT